MWLLLVISAALTYTFGRMVGDTRQGWAIFAAFMIMVLAGVFICYGFEQAGNPILAKLGIQTAATSGQAGGNMEGKEVRFGVANSTLWATITTDTSCGAVNSMHDSFLPIAGLVPLLNMMTDIVIFGGVGAGLYGILIYCIVAVFIAGLMVGRTPEYLGKKLEQKEVKMAMLAIIVTSASILVFSAISSRINFPVKGYWNPPGPAIANMNNSGPHGLSEILYAYTSSTGNNGSAFAGINGNTPWYNLTLGLAQLIGRFLFLIPILAAAGSLAAKKKVPVTSGTFPTHGPLFVGLLIGTVIIIAVLTYFPAVSLGPIVEHYLMHGGKLFSMILPSLGDLEIAMPTPTTEPQVSPRSRQTIRHRFCPRSWRGLARCSTREIVVRAVRASFVKLNPVTSAQEPGDVRRRGGRRDYNRVSDPRYLHRRRRASGSNFRSRSGSGSRCCSPISPKGWRRRAERRRRKSPQDQDRCLGEAARHPAARSSRYRRSALRAGDVVLCDAGDLIPGDGEVIDGIATVDESVITGESAPVIRESGGDRSAVTGGTKVLSDQITSPNHIQSRRNFS